MLTPEKKVIVGTHENMVIAQVRTEIIYEDGMFPVGVRQYEPEYVCGNIDLMPALRVVKEFFDERD
jgi:hypothetical protein